MYASVSRSESGTELEKRRRHLELTVDVLILVDDYEARYDEERPEALEGCVRPDGLHPLRASCLPEGHGPEHALRHQHEEARAQEKGVVAEERAWVWESEGEFSLGECPGPKTDLISLGKWPDDHELGRQPTIEERDPDCQRKGDGQDSSAEFSGHSREMSRELLFRWGRASTSYIDEEGEVRITEVTVFKSLKMRN